MTHRLVRRRRSERGISLVELMVVLGLLAVVLPTGYLALSSMQKQVAVTTDRFTALGEAQTIADRITKDLRTAISVTNNPRKTAAFAAADTNTMTFYANLGTAGPVQLKAYVPGGTDTTFH